MSKNITSKNLTRPKPVKRPAKKRSGHLAIDRMPTAIYRNHLTEFDTYPPNGQLQREEPATGKRTGWSAAFDVAAIGIKLKLVIQRFGG